MSVIVNTNLTYTFTANSDKNLTAVFEEIPVYTITATIDPKDAGTVTGTGEYREGSTCTLVATVADGYKFTGWKENDITVSENNTYSFTVTSNKSFVAIFEEKVSRLPVGYTEVEYVQIQNDNVNTYINMGGSACNRYLLDLEFSETSTDQYYLYTDNSGSGTQAIQFENKYNSTSLKYRYNKASSYTTFNVGSTKGRHTVEINLKATQIIFDSKSTSFTLSYATQLPSKLAAGANPIKWYSAEMYKNTTLLAQFVPCKNSSGTAGFYDLVRSYFYTTTTAGTISAGPEV